MNTARVRYYDTQYTRRDYSNTHSILLGYLTWIFGFMGAHRFYYGRPLTGTIWFFTLGLLGIGWIIDLFLIPSMDKDADRRYEEGPVNYNAAWILLVFLGFFGIHRMYMGKWISGFIYLFTFGLFGVGYLFDLWTLNEQADEINRDNFQQDRYRQYPYRQYSYRGHAY